MAVSVVGDAWVRLRPTSTGFEAEVVKGITPGLKKAEKAASLKVTADTSKATEPLDVLRKRLDRFAGRNPAADALLELTGNASLAAVGVTAAAVAVAAFAAKGVADFQRLAGEVRGFQRVVGTTAEDSSRFIAAFGDFAISGDVAAASLGRFSRVLATNAKALTDRGVAVATTTRGNVDVKETFLNLADAISNSSDNAQKNALVIEAFGRGGLALLPILEKGRVGIEALFAGAEQHGQLLSQEDIERAEELRLATDDLGDALTGLGIAAGKALVPFLADLANAVAGTLDFTRTIFSKIDPAQIGRVIREMAGVETQTKKTAAAGADYEANLADQAAAEKDAADALKEHADTIGKMRGAVLDATAAQRALTAANSAVTDGTEEVAEAQEKLGELLAKGAVDQDKVIAARKKLADATEALEVAERSLADNRGVEQNAQDAQITALDRRVAAEERLADLLSGRVAAEELLAHTHDLEHATLAVRSAVLAQHSAQQRLDETQADATSTADDLAGAQIDLEEANLRLIEAQEHVVDTQAELTRIQNIGKAGSDELAEAERALAAANGEVDAATQALMATYGARTELERGITDAVDAQTAAQNDLGVQLRGDVAFAGQVVDARRAVRDAEDDLTAARLAASAAAFTLAEKQQGLNAQFGGKSLDDIRETRAELEKIIKLQPGAAAFLAPALSLLLEQLFKAAIPTADFGDILAGFRPKLGPGFAAGGFTGGYGGPAWVHPREVVLPLDNATRTGELLGQAGLAGTIINAPVTIEASFGAGTNADDVIRAMTSVAEGVVRRAWEGIIAKALAGVGRG